MTVCYRLLAGAVLLTALALPLPASAADTFYSYTATVVTSNDPAVPLGTTVSGNLSWDTAAAGTDNCTNCNDYPGQPEMFTASVVGGTYAGSGGRATTVDASGNSCGIGATLQFINGPGFNLGTAATAGVLASYNVLRMDLHSPSTGLYPPLVIGGFILPSSLDLNLYCLAQVSGEELDGSFNTLKRWVADITSLTEAGVAVEPISWGGVKALYK
jgi:hypothetical protein